MNLPINDISKEIVEALKTNKAIVLKAPTGSGKSTQVPQIIYNSKIIKNEKKIIVLEPRRLATRLLAKRVAFEMNEPLGKKVGYNIRFDKCSSANTKIEFQTEAILLRQIINEPELSNIGVIIFDEFHERSIHSDISLALVKKIQEKNKDLKIVVMSATLQVEEISSFLGNCPILESNTKNFPVDIKYLEKPVLKNNIYQSIVDTFLLSLKENKNENGDYLIFLDSIYSIRKTIQKLSLLKQTKDFLIYELFADLPVKDQDKVLQTSDKRKIIVSTNVAQTSLTIEGVKIVIDSGLAKIAKFDSKRSINTFFTRPISKSSADQRAGRAGRTSSGICYRLWTKQEHLLKEENEKPQIALSESSEIILWLKYVLKNQFDNFVWFEKPPKENFEKALLLLQNLSALDENQNITAIGSQMVKYPVSPRFSRLFYEAEKRHCLELALIIASIVQSKNIFLKTQSKWQIDKLQELSDCAKDDIEKLIIVFIYAYKNTNACQELGLNKSALLQAFKIFEELKKISRDKTGQIFLDEKNIESLRKSLLVSYIDMLCKRTSKTNLSCDIIGKKRGSLDPHSKVKNSNLFICLFAEEKTINSKVETILSLCLNVEKEYLKEIFYERFSYTKEVYFDEKDRKIYSCKKEYFSDLLIDKCLDENASNEEKSLIFAELVLESKLIIKDWDQDVENFILRVNFCSKKFPFLEIKEIDEEAKLLILQEICFDIKSVKQLKDVKVKKAVKNWLSREQLDALDLYCPEFFYLKTRKKPIKILYNLENLSLCISSRIKDFYDIKNKDLLIGQGKLMPIIELLAPNMRPVQKTSNLDEFWTNSFPQILKELKGRYPKHF